MNILVFGIGNTTARNKLKNRIRSGGETKLLAMLKHWSDDKNNRIWYLTSHDYATEITSELKNTVLLKLPHWLDIIGFGFIFKMIFRIPLAVLYKNLPNTDIIYSASDLLFDLGISVIYKVRLKSAKLVSCLFLIAKKPDSFRSVVDFRQFLFYFFQQISIHLLKRVADKIFVLNQDDKNILVSRGFKPELIFVTSGGITACELDQIKPQKNQFDCVFVGRFHPQKGILLLLDAWKLVLKKQKNATLAIVGGGDKDYISRIRRRIRQLDLGTSVKMVIGQPRSIALSFMKSGRVFTFPSTYESWGFVAAEAMYMGKPVVGFDLPQTRGIFPKGMIRVSCFDINKYAQALIGLLTDSKYYNVLSQEATSKSFKYKWENVAGSELKVMQKLLS